MKKPTLLREKEARALTSRGYVIAAIKELRAANQLSLKEAKDIVESWLPKTP